MTTFAQVDGSPFGEDDRLRLDRRMEDYHALVPATYRVKGMFLQQVLDRMGESAFDTLRGDLLEPPAGRGYVLFRDYPMQDHQRLVTALAEIVYRGVPQAEAVRRHAREDFATFADSKLGAVMLALVGDASAALGRFPAVYRLVARADWEVEVSQLPGRVRMDFRRFPGLWAYQLGQVEGILRRFEASTRVHVFEASSTEFRFEIPLDVT